MKLRVEVDIDLSDIWDDPDLTVEETLDVMAEEYPSISALLGDCMDGNEARAAVRLSRGGPWTFRMWQT